MRPFVIHRQRHIAAAGQREPRNINIVRRDGHHLIPLSHQCANQVNAKNRQIPCGIQRDYYFQIAAPLSWLEWGGRGGGGGGGRGGGGGGRGGARGGGSRGGARARRAARRAARGPARGAGARRE